MPGDAQNAAVISEGDAQNARDLGMGMPKTLWPTRIWYVSISPRPDISPAPNMLQQEKMALDWIYYEFFKLD